jgi:hypothetical protein
MDTSKKYRKEDAFRYAPSVDTGKRGAAQWYVMDMLFMEAVEKDSTKGWYRTEASCQKACDKLNKQDAHAYVRLDNGYVGLASGSTRDSKTGEYVRTGAVPINTILSVL